MNNWSCLKDLIWGSYNASQNQVEFNSFLLSKVVNDVWKYPTLFIENTKFQHLLLREYIDILHDVRRLNQSINKAREYLQLHGVELKDFKSKYDESIVPFWYHCDRCHTKIPLHLCGNDSKVFSGSCKFCKKKFNFSIEHRDNLALPSIVKEISPRVILQHLIFFRGLMFSGYIGYYGGAEYLLVLGYVAKDLGYPLPPMCIWCPTITYVGIAQARAMDMLIEHPSEEIDASCSKTTIPRERIINSLILSKSQRVSMIDLAINFDLLNIERKMYQHLLTKKIGFSYVMDENVLGINTSTSQSFLHRLQCLNRNREFQNAIK